MPNRNRPVPRQVHDYLSEQSHKGNTQGGAIVKKLVELGKESLAEQYGDWREGLRRVMEERPRRSKAA